MENFNTYGEQNGDLGVQYPKSNANGSLSDASIIQKDDRGASKGPDEASGHYQTENPGLARVLAVVREYCAIGMESKIAEDGAKR